MPFIVTQGELAYQAGIVLTGTYKIFLATKGALTIASTLAQWEAAELAIANGYTAVTGTVSAAVYNSSTGRYDAPVISGAFSATGAGYTFDAMVVKLPSRTSPYAVNIYDAPITLSAGQSRGFNITLGIKP